MTSRLSFDIEIAEVFNLQPGEDLERYAPFTVSVAAAARADGVVRHWHHTDQNGQPNGALDQQLARAVLEHLREAQISGTRVFAWNGLSFDLRWLNHTAGCLSLAREIALDLFDPMFQFAMRKGYPIALAAAAEGLGIQETKLMSADRAPVEWKRGNHQLVLDYVARDCQLTNKVVAEIEAQGEVRWRTKKGVFKSEQLGELRPVREVMKDPLPDQSWMTEPREPSSYWAWLEG